MFSNYQKKRWKKMALLVLRSVGLSVGAKPNVPMCGWLKLFFKKMRRKKNKKLRVGFSVGLLVALLKYGLYVGQLSKWFVFVLMFKFWSVSCPWIVVPLPITVSGLAKVAIITTNVDAENQTLINH